MELATLVLKSQELPPRYLWLQIRFTQLCVSWYRRATITLPVNTSSFLSAKTTSRDSSSYSDMLTYSSRAQCGTLIASGYMREPLSEYCCVFISRGDSSQSFHCPYKKYLIISRFFFVLLFYRSGYRLYKQLHFPQNDEEQIL